MKQLDTQFVSGEGGFSANPLTYKQVKRNNDFAVYSRERDGVIKDYEVFKIRKYNAGHAIYQKVYQEDTEEYAAPSAFGRSAWTFHGAFALSAALKKFDELSIVPIVDETEPENESLENPTPTEPKTRGRKAVARPAVVIPTNAAAWTMKDILAINPEWTQPTMYLHIQEQIEAGKIVEKGTLIVEGGRGKKPIIYGMV